jgi:hypothetical protein
VDVPLVVGIFDEDDKNDEEERVVRLSDVGVVEIELCDAEEEALVGDCRGVIDGEAVSLDKRCKASDEKDKLLDTAVESLDELPGVGEDEEGDIFGGNEDVESDPEGRVDGVTEEAPEDRRGSEELGTDDADEDSPVIGSLVKLLETLVDILGPEVSGGGILLG